MRARAEPAALISGQTMRKNLANGPPSVRRIEGAGLRPPDGLGLVLGVNANLFFSSFSPGAPSCDLINVIGPRPLPAPEVFLFTAHPRQESFDSGHKCWINKSLSACVGFAGA